MGKTSVDDFGGGGGEYLRASDFDDGDEYEMIIAGFTVGEFDEKNRDGEEYKANHPIIQFKDFDKVWVCKKTNRTTIAGSYGKYLEDWIGKPVILFTQDVAFGDRTVKGIRCRTPKTVKKMAAKSQAPLESENPADGMSDEVPF